MVRAVDRLSLSIGQGEVLGIVGESGSGKTVSMMAVLGLIRDPNAIVEGEVLYRGRDLLRVSQRELREVRGSEIAMIFQDPMTALTPVYTVGWQIAEQLRAHESLSRRQAKARTIDLLAEVGISNPARRLDEYPHQFSGGMRQRVMIAMALSCNPSLLIADEPTTALDVTIQAQILALMKRLQQDHGSSILLITHDMGVVSELAERIIVMYAGAVVEEGPKQASFATRSIRTPGDCSARSRASVGRACDGWPRSRVRRRRRWRRPRAAASSRAVPTVSTSARPGPSCSSGSRPAGATACHLDPAVRPALRRRIA